MVKQFILLIQLIGVFFYQLVLTGDVTVSQSIPETLQVGKEVVVEIKVNKSDATGFAKVQQDLPAGFSVEPTETKGATFSFKDNRIKFIWMSLPSDEEFVISYKLKAKEGTKGEFSIGGKFSFIADSERKNVVIPEGKFKVEEEILASNEEETESPVEEIVEETTEETSEEITEETTEETTEENPVVTTENTTENEEEQPLAEVVVNTSRTIKKQEDGSFKVTIEVDKSGVEGFAKISEQIPTGFTASEIESGGGVFSFKEGVAKVLWMAIPKADQFSITYNVKSINAANGDYAIKGEFSYLENDETKKTVIETTNFTLDIEQIAENNETVENNEEEVIEENTTVEEEVVAEETTEIKETTEENTEETTEEIVEETTPSSIPNPETGVSYKVQVGAGHQTVPANYFATKFNLQDNVSTENHEGWIKYLVGSFNEYKAARDKRNKVRNNVKTAFVTAYNSGKRITVQEALMISNQKWYK